MPLQITETQRAPGSVPEIKQVAFEGIANATNFGTSLPRSKGHC